MAGKIKATSKPKAAKPIVRVDWKHSGHGWTVGTVTYKGRSYVFNMKNFIEGSVYGIDNGCISKLGVTMPNFKEEYPLISSPFIISYDRGWEIRPKTDDAKAILKALKDRFNNGMNAKDLANYKKYVW